MAAAMDNGAGKKFTTTRKNAEFVKFMKVSSIERSEQSNPALATVAYLWKFPSYGRITL